MTLRIKSILFDLDGTLIDSAPTILNALEKTLKVKGVSPCRALSNDLIGPPLRDIVNQLVGLQNPDLINELIDEFKHQYDGTYCMQALLYPGVRDVLAELVDRCVRLFVVTNKRALPTMKILKANCLLDYFDGVYSPDSLSPSADAKSKLIRHVVELNNIEIYNTGYVGDKDEDFLAASVNKLEFFYAKWGYGGVHSQYKNMLNRPVDILELFLI